MGRGNAVARVARAKERLQMAAEAQAEIGRQALEAIDGGADPETVVAIAEVAAKESLIPEEPAQETRFDQIQREIATHEANSKNLASQEKVKIKFVVADSILPCTRNGTTLTGKKYAINIDKDGFCEVAKEVADHLVANSNGKYILAE